MVKYILLSMVLFCSGCIISAPEVVDVDNLNSNAQATNAKVQTLTYPISQTDFVAWQEWMAEDAQSWSIMDNMVHGTAPAVTQPTTLKELAKERKVINNNAKGK